LSFAVALGMENNLKNFLTELRRGKTGLNLGTELRLEVDVSQSTKQNITLTATNYIAFSCKKFV